MNENQFGKGGVIDIKDKRDYKWPEIATAPIPVDWEKGYDIEEVLGRKITPKNQNGSGSCGGQAWSYYMAVLEHVATGTYEERSAYYIYRQTFVPPAGGSRGRDNCVICIKQGDARETIATSYENGNPPSENYMTSGEITSSMKDDAKTFETLSYSIVAGNIEDIASAIVNNYGCVIGVGGENNGTWLSKFPKPPMNESWGHWLYAGKVKIIDGKKYIGVINSWGNVGEDGWQYLGEEYFTSGHVWNGWTMPFKSTITLYKFIKDFGFYSVGRDVKELQKRLGVIQTNFFGVLTRKAVMNYQTRHGIPATGFVGPLTRAELNK